MIRAGLALAVLVGAAPAHADEFASLPRVATASGGGVDVAVVPYDDGVLATTALRLDPYVALGLGGGVVVTAHAPLTSGSVDGARTLGVGAPSVGATYGAPIDARTRATVGAAFALAPADLGGPAARVNAVGALGRLGDLALGRPSQVIGRLDVGLAGQRGALVLRGGLGLDLAVGLGGGSGSGPTTAPIVRAAGGVATALAPATTASAELTMLFSTRDHPEQAVSGVVLAVRRGIGRAAVHASIGVLLDGDARALVPLVLGVGVDVTP